MIDYTIDDYTKDTITPEVSTHTAVVHCLQQLLINDTHYLSDEIAPQLTYREVIQALVAANDLTSEYETELAWAAGEYDKKEDTVF